MFNSKDIYDPEWLELVFENRNKNYGAYELRKHYASTLLRSMAIAVTAISAIFIICILVFSDKVKAITTGKKVDVDNKAIYIIPDIGKRRNAATNQTHRNSGDKIVHTAVYTSSNTAIPAIEKPSVTSVENTIIPVENNTPDIHPATDAGALESDDIDIKPIPVGGGEELAKFLETNLHYPAEAKQLHISGKTWLTFVVERDGHITNITVDQPAGHGFDEEAVRVLKQSPPWTPGSQNGQTVRVKYSLPINFHIIKQ